MCITAIWCLQGLAMCDFKILEQTPFCVSQNHTNRPVLVFRIAAEENNRVASNYPIFLLRRPQQTWLSFAFWNTSHHCHHSVCPSSFTHDWWTRTKSHRTDGRARAPLPPLPSITPSAVSVAATLDPPWPVAKRALRWVLSVAFLLQLADRLQITFYARSN